MAKYTLEEIKSWLGAQFNGVDPKAAISDLLLDSRKLATTDDTLFVALKGSRHDGLDYIHDLYQRGLRNFLVTRLPANRFIYDQANFLIVEDSLKALQILAQKHREIFKLPVWGITGSNGKTIVKEWLFQLFQADRKVIRSPKSYNSQVGVPLSVWKLKAEHEMALFEAGISQPNEMQNLQVMIQPEFGLFTNIGQAHGRFFQSIEEKIREKLNLFSGVKTLIYCLDHARVAREIQQWKPEGVKVFTWSQYYPADLEISSIESDDSRTTISAIYQGEQRTISIPFTDGASIENAIHCWAVILQQSCFHLEEKMKELVPVAMRLEVKAGVNDCVLINDVYSSDLESLKIALDFVNQQQHQGNRTLILSDMLESTLSEEELYQEVASLLKKYGIHRMFAVGKSIGKFQALFDVEKHWYANTDELLQALPNFPFSGETVLLKGARKFAFEEVGQLLAQKAHTTSLEVDLNALVHNFQYFKGLLKPETKVMAMVKAFSYGAGAVQIGRMLQFHRVDYLGVAYVDEGVELRKQGIHVPIMVMNPDVSSFDTMLRFGLEPEIYSLELLEEFAKAVRLQADDEPSGFHLKIDSGMHRLGFDQSEIPQVLNALKQHAGLKVLSVFSHLAASDDPSLKSFTSMQFERFEKAYDQLCQGLGERPPRHILNSSGIENYPEQQYEMVRLGIGMYGVGNGAPLRKVASLKTRVSQVKQIAAGESVGYNRAHVAERETTIAILPIGYADGLNRKLGYGKSWVKVKGQKAHVIGAICMDMCFVDVTGLDVQVGDEVEVFGQSPSLSQVAKWLDTIPYEVLTSISGRVKRVYFQE